MAEWPPGVLLIAGALLVPLLRGRALQAYLVGLPLLSAWQLWSLPRDLVLEASLFDYTLELVRVDALADVFGAVFHLALVLSMIYALRVTDALQHAAALVYAGSAIGAVYATLERLLDKGYVRAQKGDTSPERDGRARKFFALTARGVAALEQAHALQERMWAGLELHRAEGKA